MKIWERERVRGREREEGRKGGREGGTVGGRGCTVVYILICKFLYSAFCSLHDLCIYGMGHKKFPFLLIEKCYFTVARTRNV